MKRRSILSNVGWLTADRIIRLVGGLLVGVWIARYLGPTDFGLLNYSIAFSSIFGILGTLGLDGIVIRETVSGRFVLGELLGTALQMRILGALAGLFISIGFALCLGNGDSTLAMIAIGSAVYLSQSLYVIDWYYQATSNNKPSVIAQNAGFLVSTIIKVLMIVLKMPVIAFAASNLLEASVASTLMLVMYRRALGRGTWKFDAAIARNLLSQSWPLILSGFAFMVYVRVDQVMVGQILGERSVGVYAAAVRISEVWNMVPVIVVTATFPRLLELRIINPVAYAASVQRLFSALAGISIAAAVGTQIAGNWAVLLLYGEPYAEAAPILKISIWSAIFASLGFASGRWLIAEGLTKYALLRNLIGVVVNIGANLILIPWLGAKGAAIGTLISYVFANLISYTTNRRLHPLFWINIKSLLLAGLLQRRVAR